jgi:hypothetical protein
LDRHRVRHDPPLIDLTRPVRAEREKLAEGIENRNVRRGRIKLRRGNGPEAAVLQTRRSPPGGARKGRKDKIPR